MFYLDAAGQTTAPAFSYAIPCYSCVFFCTFVVLQAKELQAKMRETQELEECLAREAREKRRNSVAYKVS